MIMQERRVREKIGAQCRFAF